MSDRSGNKTKFLIAAVLVAIWGIMGVMDQSNVPYSGYFTDGNNTVTQVLAGSPAEAGGLEVGDYITTSGGVAVEDTKTLSERPRAAIGETRTLVVERGGETVDVDITFTQLAGRANMLAYISALIGFCFLIFGVLPYTRAQTANNRLLALMGIGLAFAFLPGPYLEGYAARTAVGSLVLVAILFGFAFLMHFMVSYPKPKAWTEKSWAGKAIYSPASLVSLIIVYIIVARPDATSGLNTIVSIMFGVFVVYYFGAAIVAMFKSYAAAGLAERASQGLTMMLAGVMVGLVPVTLASLVGIFAPQVVLPGSNFYFITLVLIPITLYLAVSKDGGAVVPVAASAAPATQEPAAPVVEQSAPMEPTPVEELDPPTVWPEEPDEEEPLDEPEEEREAQSWDREYKEEAEEAEESDELEELEESVELDELDELDEQVELDELDEPEPENPLS